jgi:Major Facilitator Superfamily
VQAATALDRLPVRRLLGRRDFRRLLVTRLLSQFGDGVFQAALAGTVLFNPERAADPLAVAAGFAVLLLPYSLVGPFAGVWLDRWSRRQVLLCANAVRAVLVVLVAALVAGAVSGLPFYGAGLAVFSVNRFVLAALSAALPHTTAEPDLVPANAVSTTSGAVATVLGGGAALVLLHLVGAGNGGYGVLAASSAGPYLLAAAVAGRFGRAALGPDSSTRSARLTAGHVLTGLAAGARHVWTRPPAAAALGAIGLHRFCYGLLTLMILLLYRNTFAPGGGLFPGGLMGLGEVVAAGAAGTLLAAVVTPPAVRRLGLRRWLVLLLAGGGIAQLALGLPVTAPSVVAGALLLGFVAQAVKICVDSTLQEEVADEFRGRVFSLYDTLFNVLFVAGLLVAAGALPASGRSAAMLVAIAVLYLVGALGYRSRSSAHTVQGRVR